MAYHK